ncbi:hypothetical protein KA012_00790 [Candidatus Woesebacteria bacterium]|nr:hypothetical protein [Candidatus Woesebacteria bacterium]
MTDYRLQQKAVIDQIAEQVATNKLRFTTVGLVDDYENDTRMALTCVHLPDSKLLNKIVETFIAPLQAIEPEYYYYPTTSLHLTIKNIRVVADSPSFGDAEIALAKKVCSSIIPNHKQFNVYFYRLLLFPNSLALIGTTDPELDEIHLDLDQALTKSGIPDDKVYTNKRYFFSNMTLARFNSAPSAAFRRQVAALSDAMAFETYTVDSLTLLRCNAALQRRTTLGTWDLKQ